MRRAPNQPDGISTINYGGVYIKTWRMPDAGMIVPQHAHTYDHISYLAAGMVNVRRGGELIGRYAAPAAIRIPACEKHTFTTLLPGTVILCIHNAAHGEAADIHEEHHLVTED